MTRVIYYTATTLNGYLADEADSLEWLFAVDQGGENDIQKFQSGIGVLVEGSTTYEWLLREMDLLAKPGRWQEFYGAVPTYVFTSRELPMPQGADVRFVRGEASAVLPDILRAADGKDVWMMGGGDLAGQFFDAGALDEIVLSVAPVTLVSGAPLLPRRIESDRLTLRSVARQGQFARLVYTVRAGA